MHIPIEVIRTVVAISETGSLSKAGERLGLSQPAISSQVKRLQSMIGGSLFVKTANGTTTTELGKLALHHARRILEANDQMLRLGGNTLGPKPLRLGLSTLFVPEFVKHQTQQSLANVLIHTDHSTAIGKGLTDGYIDMACIYENETIKAEVEELVINEFEEPMLWVRSKDFVLSPGAPIPLLTWPGDDWMIRTMVKQGLSYRIVFSSPDFHAKLAALRGGHRDYRHPQTHDSAGPGLRKGILFASAASHQRVALREVGAGQRSCSGRHEAAIRAVLRWRRRKRRPG
ncbi:LysR family transcriptional regulator [Bradyrhizobium sp. OAE829]|uniref:LysR family transcriptional regulator n=1 Tax=Bradyrhizobium sp. OAE829 TaxID=2663807 RepID=UPI00339767B3